MTTSTKAKKKAITPYKGDQLTFQFEYKVPASEIFDFSAYGADEMVGSSADQFYTSAELKESNHRRGGVAGYEAIMWASNSGWHGYPMLPMDYGGMNFRGLRGGLARQQNSGYYIGPGFTDGKFRLKHSPLAGPVEFPWAKKNAKVTRDRVTAINAYVKEWERWWNEWGCRDPLCRKELDVITAELDRWKGITLTHWCRPMESATDLGKRLM